MRQYKHQVCLLQSKIVRWRADHISLSWRHTDLYLVTVPEAIQTQANHGRGPQCVQKHVAKLATILGTKLGKNKPQNLLYNMREGLTWNTLQLDAIILSSYGHIKHNKRPKFYWRKGQVAHCFVEEICAEDGQTCLKDTWRCPTNFWTCPKECWTYPKINLTFPNLSRRLLEVCRFAFCPKECRTCPKIDKLIPTITELVPNWIA